MGNISAPSVNVKHQILEEEWGVISLGVLISCLICWAIQVELLTLLTFTQHRLSPLAVFTSGAYFLHNRTQ